MQSCGDGKKEVTPKWLRNREREQEQPPWKWEMD